MIEFRRATVDSFMQPGAGELPIALHRALVYLQRGCVFGAWLQSFNRAVICFGDAILLLGSLEHCWERPDWQKRQ